jgi:hypothetical protein
LIRTWSKNNWLRPVLPAGAFVIACLLWFAGAPGALAEENVVSIEPFGVRAPPGGTFEVSVVTDPPPQTVATWIIFLEFDPTFVTTESTRCDALDTPAGAVAATGCEVVDTNNDGLADTAKLLGGVIFTESEQGLSEESTLADITFDVLPGATGCTFLTLKIIYHTDADANETGARVRDARVCSDAAAPAVGTVDPQPPEIPIRTSEPPTDEDRGESPGGDDDDGGDDGDSDNGDGDGSGGGDAGGTGSAATGAPVTDASGNPVSPTRTPLGTAGRSPADAGGGESSAGGGDGDDGGMSPVVWVLGALAALGAAGGGAWWVVRSRAASAPGPGVEP